MLFADFEIDNNGQKLEISPDRPIEMSFLKISNGILNVFYEDIDKINYDEESWLFHWYAFSHL